MTRFLQELFLRYQYRCNRHELELAEEFLVTNQAARIRASVKYLEDRLREIGVDPSKTPEDLTKTLEVWIMGGILAGCLAIGFLWGAIVQLIQERL